MIRQLVFIFLFSIFCYRTWGAVTYDNSASDYCGTDAVITCDSGGTALIYPLTVGAGSNRALAVFATIMDYTSHSITGVTYNGVALNLVESRSNSVSSYRVELWSLPPGTQPATGTNNVVLTLSSGAPLALLSAAISVSGVDQTNTFTSQVAIDSGSTGEFLNYIKAAIQIPSSGPNDLVICYACNGCDTPAWDSPATARITDYVSCSIQCNSQGLATAPGGTTRLSWTIYDDWNGMIAASFKAAGVTTKPQKYNNILLRDPVRTDKLQTK